MDMLTARLEFLERLININTEQEKLTQGHLLDRLAKLESMVNKLFEQNSTISTYEKKYQQSKELLEQGSELSLEADSMQIPVKAELILASENYIRETLGHLQKIKELQSHINSPSYSNIVKLSDRITKEYNKSQKTREEYIQLSTQISKIVDTYHSEINGLSELFLQSDLILTKLEAQVTALEESQTY